MFFVNSVLLGVGLSMDAFSVSLANGLNEQQMRHGKMCAIAAVFAVFQGLMPLLGWVCVHTVLQYFEALEKFVPFVALALLCFVGIKMIVEGVRNKGKQETAVVGVAALLVQGVATSIDALSVGSPLLPTTLHRPPFALPSLLPSPLAFVCWGCF